MATPSVFKNTRMIVLVQSNDMILVGHNLCHIDIGTSIGVRYGCGVSDMVTYFFGLVVRLIYYNNINIICDDALWSGLNYYVWDKYQSS